MSFDLFLWVEIFIVLALFLLMVIDYRRNGEDLFKFLSIVFFIALLKAGLYLIINFTEVKWTIYQVARGSDIYAYSIPRDTPLAPLYAMKNFIYQAAELVFIIALSYSFIIKRRSVADENTKRVKSLMWIQIIAIVLIVGAVVGISMTSKEKIIVKDTVHQTFIDKYLANPNFKIQPIDNELRQKFKREFFDNTQMSQLPPEVINQLNVSDEVKVVEGDNVVFYTMYRTYQTTNGLIEFAKSVPFQGILIGWKILLLIFTIRSIASIYGYIANILKSISENKGLVYAYSIMSILFYIASPILYSQPYWFSFEVVTLILFSIFTLRVHNRYITDFEEMVENLEREKNIIIDLMRDISAIIGAGDFELDTVIQHIVDASVQGARDARGGTILLKDAVTNRLIVKYVNGLYPPTKPFKIVSGMTLTESVIVEKLKSEKIAVGEGLLGQVVESGEPIYIPDVLKDERFVQTIKDTMTVTSFIAVPLRSKDEVFGVLSVVHDELPLLESDLSLIETLGEQAAITIKQIQMYQEILDKKQAEKELGVAGQIQASLVPHTFPESGKFEMFAFSIPAKGVGGDYYDYIQFSDNKIAVTMFDVSGKGVPAALIMVMIRSILRTIASLEEDTKEILTKLNNTISEEIVEDRYATGFYLLFDAEKGIMSYTNAGHGPLILYRTKRDEFEMLDTDGMPVGIMTGVEYGQNYTTLETGDIAMLYTDGISEAMNEVHEEFGLDRLYNVIRTNKRESARELANKVLEEVNRFVGTAPQHDDETLLIIKMR